MSSDSDLPTATPSPASDGDFTSEVLRRLAEREKPYGRYQLEGEVAHGGQGAVLRVWDEDLRRHLAMKVILGEGEAAKSLRSRKGERGGCKPPPDTPFGRLRLG